MIIKYCIIQSGVPIVEGTQEEVDLYWLENFMIISRKHFQFGVVLDKEYIAIQDIPDDVWQVLTKEQKLELDKFFS